MKPSQVVSQNLLGLKYYPKPFPDHIWDQEFEKVNIDVFSKAVKFIRSNESEFPTYSKVRAVMAELLAKEHANTRAGEYDRTPEDQTEFEKRRGVFWKWKNWLNQHENPTAQNMLEYYDGCARDYLALKGDSEYLGYVDELFALADQKQRVVDGFEDKYGKRLK